MPQKQIVFITGCSSGIGYELLKLFDQPNYLTIGTALPNSYDDLIKDECVESPNIIIEKLDIRDFDAATTLTKNIIKKHGAIDILINNAGISYRSVIEDMCIDEEYHQLEVNYLGAMHLIRCVLPSMRVGKQGRIINISSVGGMMAMPTMASYSASKFALEGATEALWYEVKPWNIHVSLVRPGFINSLAFTKVFYSKKRLEQRDDQTSAYDAHYKFMTKFVSTMMNRTPSTSHTVAKTIFRVAMSKNPPLRVAGTPDASIFYFIRRIFPRRFYHKLLYRFLPGVKRWGDNISQNNDE